MMYVLIALSVQTWTALGVTPNNLAQHGHANINTSVEAKMILC